MHNKNYNITFSPINTPKINSPNYKLKCILIEIEHINYNRKKKKKKLMLNLKFMLMHIHIQIITSLSKIMSL